MEVAAAGTPLFTMSKSFSHKSSPREFSRIPGEGYRPPQSSFASSRDFRATAPSDELPADRDLHEGLSLQALRSLNVPNLGAADAEVEVRNLESLSSYNWTNDKTPTIIVPGEAQHYYLLPTILNTHHSRISSGMEEQANSIQSSRRLGLLLH